MMMRAEMRAHQSRAAHPPDKACGALVARGAPRKRSREGGESDVKKNTNWYLHNQWQVGNLYAQKSVKIGESAFGSILMES